MESNITTDRRVSESAWTQELLRLGEAELAASDPHRTEPSAGSQAPDSPAERTSARDARLPAKRPQTPKRKPNGKQPKTELLKVRLTPEERAELEAMAAASSMSRFVRRLLREERLRA
jgi:hypothetical protein